MLRFAPLLALLWLAYNVLIASGLAELNARIAHLTLPSKAVWEISLGDGLIFLGVLLLYAEVLKATNTQTSALFDHALSVLVFALFLVEFLIVPQAGNSVFFALMLMALIDVVAGFSVTIVAARRDVDLDR
ncbi:hypothetical protein JCM13664_09850 [Methylothermus subterraneus]